jgi:hypothetical protein
VATRKNCGTRWRGGLTAMARAQRNPVSSIRHCGGLVTVTPVRDRLGEGSEAYSVSYHSPSGDLAWLSPPLASEDHADAAARCVADLTGSSVRR